MLRLLTDVEVIQLYGDPFPHLQDDGSVSAAWPDSMLDSFALAKPLPLSWGGKATKVSCHRAVMPELKMVFDRIAGIPAAWSSIDDYGGCYNWRRNRNNPRKVSRHGWGIAIDLDVADNPNGGVGEMHPAIIQLFYDAGWLWGGWFASRRDPMHFEKGAVV